MCDIDHEDIKIATMNYIDNIQKNSPDKNKFKAENHNLNSSNINEEEITKKKKKSRNRKKKKKTDFIDNEDQEKTANSDTTNKNEQKINKIINECPDDITIESSNKNNNTDNF